MFILTCLNVNMHAILESYHELLLFYVLLYNYALFMVTERYNIDCVVVWEVTWTLHKHNLWVFLGNVFNMSSLLM